MRWTFGVAFGRRRHSFACSQHGLTMDVCTLTRGGPHGWMLMVAKKYWWVGADDRRFRNLRSARALSGRRADLLAWLRGHEIALER
jgi:hypothetical protein